MIKQSHRGVNIARIDVWDADHTASKGKTDELLGK